jgi:glycosyltransferase involved in cell wall biosynthesis
VPHSPGPRISIVTPCLNSASTLAKALDSVAQQGFTDVEHIVVDGGSTDGTVELLTARTNVKWVSEPDMGLSDAMNKGVAMASGDLIGWLNADDWYLPGAFDAVVAAADRHPEAPWVTGQCVIVDGTGDEIRRSVSRYKNFWLRHYTFGRYLTNNFISCPATFIRSNAYRVAGQYDLAHSFSMDYDMFLRVGRLGDPAIINDDLAVFTMAEGTKSMSGFETQFREHFQIARARGRDHRFAVMINLAFSTSVIAVYKAMRILRRVRQGPDASLSA